MKKFMMGIVTVRMIVAAGVLVPINGASVYERLTAPSPNDTFSVGEIKRVGELSVLSVKYSENQTIDNGKILFRRCHLVSRRLLLTSLVQSRLVLISAI